MTFSGRDGVATLAAPNSTLAAVEGGAGLQKNSDPCFSYAPNTSGAQRKDKVFFSTFIEKVAKPTYIPTHSNGLLKSRN